jgi:enoyl-CoA hydratase/carnithine racemase
LDSIIKVPGIDAAGVARVCIEGSGPLNLINSKVASNFARSLRELALERALRVVVISSDKPRAFVGGADMREMALLGEPESARDFITALHAMCEAARNLPVPSICAISSWCLGVGLELAAACDLRIAADDAQFAMPEVKLGIPSVIHAALLSRLIGEGRARWLMLTGEVIDAEQAERWGLINRVVARASFDAAVAELALELAATSPSAMRGQKRVLRAGEAPYLDTAMNHSIELFGAAYESQDPERLMLAFLNKPRKSPRDA